VKRCVVDVVDIVDVVGVHVRARTCTWARIKGRVSMRGEKKRESARAEGDSTRLARETKIR